MAAECARRWAQEHGGCDFCTRTDVRIKRQYRGLRYCATCYAREFKPRVCPGCGDTARLPVDHAGAVCRACERRALCMHCGKVDERRGRTTAEGRLCNACVQRLRPAERCELCGTPSNRLSRNSSLGHDLRVCPRCARAHHDTCAACGRHRPVEDAADGGGSANRAERRANVPARRADGQHPQGTAGAAARAARRSGRTSASRRSRPRLSRRPSPSVSHRSASGSSRWRGRGRQRGTQRATRPSSQKSERRGATSPTTPHSSPTSAPRDCHGSEG